MNPIKYIWTNPYPEAILWPITQLFKRISVYMEKKPISDRRYRIQCLVISVVSFLMLFLLTGTENPLEFFVDIPIYDLSDFNTLVGGDDYALLTYMIGGAIVAAVTIYLIRLFLFNGKEFSLYSVNGICFEITTVFVTALLDIPIQKLAYTYAMTWLPSIEGKDEIGIFILGLTLNFALYFVIQDSFSAILSSALALELIMFFQDRLCFSKIDCYLHPSVCFCSLWLHSL